MNTYNLNGLDLSAVFSFFILYGPCTYHSNLKKKNTTRTNINILLTPLYSSTKRVAPY
jgi:hypothetical protein